MEKSKTFDLPPFGIPPESYREFLMRKFNIPLEDEWIILFDKIVKDLWNPKRYKYAYGFCNLLKDNPNMKPTDYETEILLQQIRLF